MIETNTKAPAAQIAVFAMLFVGIAVTTMSQTVDRGFKAANSYAASGIDAVNLTNGNLVMNLPVASLPAGRGGSPGYSIVLQYNSKLWDTRSQTHNDGVPDEYGNVHYSTTKLIQSQVGGWRFQTKFAIKVYDRLSFESPNPCWLGDPVEPMYYRWKLEMLAPDGTVRTFVPETGRSSITGMYSDGYANIDPNGTRYIAAKYTDPNCWVDQQTSQVTTSGMTYISMDGSRLRLYIPYSPSVPVDQRNWKLFYPDGTLVENVPPDDSAVAQRMSDRNGNKIEHRDGKIIDDAGRYIDFVTDSNPGTIVRTRGVGGEPVDVRVVWGDRYVYRKYKITEALNTQEIQRYENLNEILQVVERIVFPQQSGSQEMVFSYAADVTQPSGTTFTNGWGELNSVILPSEPTVDYTYYNEALGGSEGTLASEVMDRYVVDKVMTFQESYDQQSSPTTRINKWLYGVSKAFTSFSGPDGSGTSENLVHDIGISHWDSGLAWATTNADGTRTDRVWATNLPYTFTGTQNPPGGWAGVGSANSYVKTELTTLPDATGVVSSNSLTAIKDFKYDKNGNLLEVSEYDWVSYGSVNPSGGRITSLSTSGLSLLRKTVNTYYNQAADADSPYANGNEYANASAPKLLNLIKSTEIRDGYGVVKSRTEFYYDDVTTTGNLIETRTWDSSKQLPVSNPLTASNSVSSFAVFDEYGNVTEAKDAKGIESRFTFGDVTCPSGTVSGLYPTQTKAASGTDVERTWSATYDCNTGLTLSTTDVDNGVTNATVYDNLGRPIKSITAQGTPAESWTVTEYHDLQRYVVVKSDLESLGDGKKVAIQHYDQLGRVRLARTLEDAALEDPDNESHGIKVQTRYLSSDGTDPAIPAGSYALSSNPYRSGTSIAASNEESMGWSLSYTNPRGTHSETTSYSGANLPHPWGSSSSSTGTVISRRSVDRTLVTDQAGKSRISKTNVLGQLAEVWEILSAPEPGSESVVFPGTTIAHGFKTTYAYDTLNNLTSVSQGVQTRTFGYSSLSRLLSATNPESGTIAYAYDPNGNLTTKTDARNVVTTYAYDALNRVTNRSYAAPTNLPNYQATPAVSYFYDNLPNAKGKLIKVQSSVSTTEYTAFDILGRVTAHKQTTDGVGYETGYAYNLSGAMVEQTYPSGRVVKNVLDASGDLSMVQSARCMDAAAGTGAECSTQAGLWNYARHFTYNAAGAVTSMQLGNGRWESTVFNSRLQPVQIALGSTGTAEQAYDLLKLDYGYGGANNNGNVLSQTITVKRPNQSDLVFDQLYTYDSLNRISSAEEKTGTTVNWNQTYTFDRYGNRNFNESLTTTLPKNCGTAPNFVVCAADVPVVNPSVNAANNRLNGTTYDAAGNVITDSEGRSFIYDAENKQVEVENSLQESIGKYWFDGDGKRIKKDGIAPDGQPELTVFVYDAGGKLIGEYSTNVETAAPKVQYLTADHLGSPRINTDQNGTVTSRTDYMPYGEEISSTERIAVLAYNSDDVRQKFTGYERDIETELDFAQARMYQTDLGRFTAVDPYNIIFEKETGSDSGEKHAILLSFISCPQLWNRYLYVSNNPLKFVDPSGEILELTGDERDRQQAFDRVKQLVGEKAASRLKMVEKDGRYFVEYTGSSDGMWAADKMAGIVADLIDSTVTNEFRIVYGNSVTDALGQTFSFAAQGGAVTSAVSASRTQIFVSYNAVNIADGVGHKDASGNSLRNTIATIDAHEFGHAWGIQKDNIYNRVNQARGEWGEWISSVGSSRGTKEHVLIESNNSTAVMVENIVRDRLKLPRKVKHQP